MLAEIALVVLSSLGAGFLPEVSPELTAAVEEAVEAQGRPFDIVHIEDTMPLGDDLLAVLTFGRERGDGLHFYFMLMDSQTFKLALVVDYLSTQRETPGGHTQYLLFGFDRAVPTSITLARREEMYGIPQGKVKYFIDLEQGKVLTKQEPPHFIVDAVAVGEGAVYCAGRLPRVPEPERADDWYRQHIMVVPNPAPGEYGTPVFVSEIGGKEIPCLTHTGEPGANDVAFEGPETRCDLREGAWRLVDATPDPDPVPIGPFTMAGSARRKAISAMVDESALLSLNEPEDSSLLVVNHAPSAPTLGTHLDSGIGVADAEGC
ncbi:MAG: hypothetical protein GY851_18420, partial [bacterium]|nr:hypothetical protein [bacterium]